MWGRVGTKEGRWAPWSSVSEVGDVCPTDTVSLGPQKARSQCPLTRLSLSLPFQNKAQFIISLKIDLEKKKKVKSELKEPLRFQMMDGCISMLQFFTYQIKPAAEEHLIKILFHQPEMRRKGEKGLLPHLQGESA